MEKTRISRCCQLSRRGYVVVVLTTFRTSVTADTARSSHTDLRHQTPGAASATAAAADVGRVCRQGKWEAMNSHRRMGLLNRFDAF